MGVHRNFPNTDVKRNTALFLAKTKKDNTAPAYMALTTNTIARLDVTQVLFSQKIEAKYFALAEQAASTTAKKISQAKTKKLISHFIQGFNNGVGREVLSAPDRAFFHLDINSNSVPSLGKESDITFWGDNLIEGDAIRVAAGGAPMANPTIAELEAEYNIFVNLNSEQSTLKDAYDKAQEAVSNMRVEVDKLILRIWDGVETFYDSEELPSLRRKAREWGVTYVSRHKGVIRGTVTDAANGKPLQSVSVKLIEAEEFTETDAEGNYLFRTSYTGACTLEFKLENYFTQTFKIEIPEGASLTQDAAMRGV
jgi:hypothetical protein